MKREGHLIERIAEWNNLRLAFALAARGRRQQGVVRAAGADLDAWLARLGRDVRSGTVEVGGFHRFVIHDPKRRMIHAAPFRERVLHHAIMNIAGPIFERIAIFDSYACRPGKGPHRARARAAEFARQSRHFLKLDVRRYFDSVSHSLLVEQLRRLFKDADLLRLLERIVASYDAGPGRGLPIGSLVSQHAANAYLAPLDRFVKETLRAPGYVRYMDDFLLWHDDARRLVEWREAVRNFLTERLLLDLKEPVRLGACRDGIPFLGARVTPRAIFPDRRSRHRLARKLRGIEAAYGAGMLDAAELQRRAWALLAAVGDTRATSWRRRMLVAQSIDA